MYEIKFKESLWDKARENRPNIFNREKNKIESFAKTTGLDNLTLTKEQLSKLLLDNFDSFKNKKNISMQDLHLEFSKILHNSENFPFFYEVLLDDDRTISNENSRKSKVNYFYPAGILFSLFISDYFKLDKEKAVNLSVGFFKEFNPAFLFREKHKRVYLEMDVFISYLIKNKITNAGPHTADLFNCLCNYFSYYIDFDSKIEEINSYSTTKLPNQALNIFENYLKDCKNRSIFSYPFKLRRFVGAFPKRKLKEQNYFYSGAEIEYGNLNIKNLNSAAILMFPWEADHLLKAEEMIKRGIKVAKPLGKIFVNDVEFGLFEYIYGKRLDHILDTNVWQEFGKIAKKCHETGIILNDLAGRNAIFTGNEIKLIDFEHTYFYPKVEKLSNEDKETSISRIESELEEYGKKLKDAFFRGYRKINS